MNNLIDNRILRPAQAAAFLGVCRSTLWRFEKQPGFPKKVQLGTKSIGWKALELSAWIDSKQAN